MLAPHAYQVNDHRSYGTYAPLSWSGDSNGGGSGDGGGGVGLLNLNQLYKLEPSTLGLWCGVLRQTVNLTLTPTLTLT